MAKDRTEVRTMVRGMGMGMKLLELLLAEIRKQKGQEEILAFLTRPRFETNLQKAVETLVKSDWRIPVSEMRTLAEKDYRNDFDVEPERLDEVRNLWWYAPLQDLGIPYDSYDNDPETGIPAIPPALLEELHGKKMEYPLWLMNGKYIVVDWSTGDEIYKPGDVIDSNKIGTVSIAESRHFNFHR